MYIALMPKVLRIINRFNLGGPTYNAAYLTAGLSGEFETMLIGGVHEEGEISSTYINDELGIDYKVLPTLRRSINFKQDQAAYREICSIIRGFKPDIVHTHASKAGAIGRWAAFNENVPVVIHTFHGHVFEHYFGRAKTQFYKSVERRLARKSSAIIAISPKQKEELCFKHKIASPRKTHIIPLGFDLQRFTADKEEKRQSFRAQFELNDEQVAIGIIGRFAPIKNHRLFIEAFSKIDAPNKVAVFIGDGEERANIEVWLREYGVPTEQVRLCSWITNIDWALAGLDVVALSSLNEGTPVSLIEAQAAGVPVVSTDVGGVRDVIDHQKSGFIVSQEANDFAFALQELVTSPALRRKMGDHGTSLAFERFTKERLIADVRELYLRLLSSV
jgi:glycosyltransferase involved in cell wall biosynthesis